jgi:hypothetical protein
MSDRYRTRGFRALGHAFTIEAESDRIGRYFERLLSGFAKVDEAEHRYLIRTTRDDDGNSSFEIVGVDELSGAEEQVATDASIGALAGTFVHHVNRVAIDAGYGVMCHAGGVERDGIAVVLPADPESGKTTLTAGLVRAGFAYLTDEAVAFVDGTSTIEPFPKPLSIDAGSHHLFPELEPAPAPGDDAAPSDQWQVPPDAIRARAVGGRCRARFIVFPKYEAEVATELTPLSRASALVELATNTFDFRDHPRRSLEVLGDVVRGAQCFRMAVGNLDDACALIADLVEGAGLDAHG